VGAQKLNRVEKKKQRHTDEGKSREEDSRERVVGRVVSRRGRGAGTPAIFFTKDDSVTYSTGEIVESWSEGTTAAPGTEESKTQRSH